MNNFAIWEDEKTIYVGYRFSDEAEEADVKIMYFEASWHNALVKAEVLKHQNSKLKSIIDFT